MARQHVRDGELRGTPTRPQEIAGKLTRRILKGDYPTGARLPTERELAAEFETTRNVVREALKRLEAVGLIRILRGSGIYVENLQLTGGVELFDVLMTHDDGSLNVAFLRDTLELRGYVIRLIVRLAAVRRTPDELEHIRTLLGERAARREDPPGIADITLQLFREIAFATHNQVCHLMINTVDRVSIKLRAMVDTQVIQFAQSQEVFERLLDAFERRDDAMAELVVIRYLEAIEKAFALEPAPLGLLPLGAPPPSVRA
jgi:GntR family transcriptional regulator, transcriptional repressor for pyruvate dehydrogenase complex